MKKNAIILFSLGLVFLMAGICQAAPYKGPIVMVEADDLLDDGDMDVTCTITPYLDPGWTVGEWNGSSFSVFSDVDDTTSGMQVKWSGGTVVDFAVQSTSSILYLSQGTHEVKFLGELNTGTVQAPLWVTKWWDDAVIEWAGGPTVNIEIVSSNNNADGLAPVPIPSAVLLLGSGMVGLVGFRKKFRS